MQIKVFALLFAFLVSAASAQSNDTTTATATLAPTTTSIQIASVTPVITSALPVVPTPTPTPVSQIPKVATTVENGVTKIITIYADPTTRVDSSSTSGQPAFFSSQTNIIAVSVAGGVLVLLIILIVFCFRRSRKQRDISYRPSEHLVPEMKSSTPPLAPLDNNQLHFAPHNNSQDQFLPFQPSQQQYFDHSSQQFFYGEDGQVYEHYHGEPVYHEEQPQQTRAYTRG